MIFKYSFLLSPEAYAQKSQLFRKIFHQAFSKPAVTFLLLHVIDHLLKYPVIPHQRHAFSGSGDCRVEQVSVHERSRSRQ